MREGSAPHRWVARFQGAAIRTKLILIIMSTVLATLLLVELASFVIDFDYQKNQVGAELKAVAKIIASHNTAALAFQDERAMYESLASLGLRPNVVTACIVGSSGVVAALYRRPGSTVRCPETTFDKGEDLLQWKDLTVNEPIILDGKTIGSLFVTSDLSEIPARLLFQGLVSVIVALVASVFAYFLSLRIERLVSRPILELAETATKITSTQNYSIRANQQGYNEVASLVGAFNQMLDAVEYNQRERERLLAEAKAAIQVRDDFISIASHELRTPITPLKSQVQIIEKLVRTDQLSTYPRERLIKLLDVTDKQLNRISSLVNDLLDVTRISFGRLTLNIEDVDVDQLVRDVVQRLYPRCSLAPVPIFLDLGVKGVAHWDRLRIEQVIVNLLTNAVKYGEGRPVMIRTRQMGERIVLSVQDKGIGIAPEDSQRIFRRFERATSMKHFGGLGLGLYITAQIVAAHHGSIRVQSALSQGSTFIVELPFRVEAAATDVREDSVA